MDELVEPNLELDIFKNPQKIFFLFAECSLVRPAGGNHLAATFPFYISAMLQLLVFNLPHEQCSEHSEAAASSSCQVSWILSQMCTPKGLLVRTAKLLKEQP